MRDKIFLVLFLSLWCIVGFSQANDALHYYENWKEETISNRYIKHEDVKRIVNKLEKDNRFRIRLEGCSLEGREIYSVEVGEGPIKVLLWSQMHGDEPTATMAMMDFFRFLQDRSVMEDKKQKILDRMTLRFIPMLNPDGAARFDRRNAAGIDLNRDALRLQCPESRILKAAVDSWRPDWGFNLHDQSRYYTAGHTELQATFSFLAPAFNEQREVNAVRLRAMQLIGHCNEYLQSFLPGGVGRYSDAFEPRAFGDNITKWGTSTVLIECGGLEGDPEKQEIRRLHFGLYVDIFDCLADQCYRTYTQEDYAEIPNNRSGIRDLILREVLLPIDTHEVLVDIAFQEQEWENTNATASKRIAEVIDIGDLSTSSGLQELPPAGLRVVKAKVYPELFAHPSDLPTAEWRKLAKQGYGVFLTSHADLYSVLDLPVKWANDLPQADTFPSYGSHPVFFLADAKTGRLQYLVHQAEIYDLSKW